jgi:hypothetical protein
MFDTLAPIDTLRPLETGHPLLNSAIYYEHPSLPLDAISGITYASSGSVGPAMGPAPGTLAYTFDGSTGRQYMRALGSFPKNSPFTLSVWCQGTSNAVPYQTAWANSVDSGNRGNLLLLWHHADQPQGVLVYINGGFIIGNAPNKFNGRWHHLAVIGSSGGLNLYFDAQVIASSGSSANSGNVINTFGTNDSIWPMLGSVHGRAAWSRALSATEVAQLYLGGRTGYPTLLRRRSSVVYFLPRATVKGRRTLYHRVGSRGVA